MESSKYLIIGNGIAGLTAAKEIRKKDKDASIMIISKDSHLTYYRVRLTEALEKDIDEEDLIVFNESWYEENNIDLKLNKNVAKIDESNQVLVLDDGQKIHYEKLLIVTGGKAFTPPIDGKDKEGVFTLRTLEDLKNIRTYIKNKKNVIVIGGGLLGLEAAWALKEQEKEVSVIEFAPYLLPKQLDEELGKKLEESLTEYGLNIYVPAICKEIMGKDKVESVKLDTGVVLKADAVIISTRIRANIEIAEGTSLKVNKGIVVDENLKTNIANIYAAGDVAEFEETIVGLWTTSMEQGRIAGLNMAGGNETYSGIKPFTRLSLKDIKVFSAGDISEYEDMYLEDSDNKSKKIFTRDNKIIGGILFGDLKEMNILKEGIFSHKDLEEYLNRPLK